MKNPNFLVQVLPILTIILCIVFFIIYKILTRIKNQAMGYPDTGKSADSKLATLHQKSAIERLSLKCPALIERSEGFTKVGIKEISLTGAFVTCPKPFPVCETFQIKIIFDREKSLTLQAEVLWNNDNVPQDQVVARGMKVRFLQLTRDEQLFIKEIFSAAEMR
jgi:hypothetical protein